MTTVPADMPVPVMRSPAPSVPLVTAVTHNVVPEIDPVATALGVAPTLPCVKFWPQLQPGIVEPCPECRYKLFGAPVFQSSDLKTVRDAIGGYVPRAPSEPQV